MTPRLPSVWHITVLSEQSWKEQWETEPGTSWRCAHTQGLGLGYSEIILTLLTTLQGPVFLSSWNSLLLSYNFQTLRSVELWFDHFPSCSICKEVLRTALPSIHPLPILRPQWELSVQEACLEWNFCICEKKNLSSEKQTYHWLREKYIKIGVCLIYLKA